VYQRPAGYRPGLDGVRALAVLAVILYHLGTTGGPRSAAGGFLGVDVFFVLSGYLITSLLVAQRRRDGRIALGHFYGRRARRLLPALYTLLAAVVIAGAWLPAQAHRLRGDVLAALGYVTNWWLIFRGTSYFGDVGAPPLLNHLWSLAVEEQFYLLWPVVLIVALWVARGRTWLAACLAVLGVAGSTALMAVLYSPWTDASRAYFGTDTHAAPLLVGAALALVPIPRDFFAIGGVVGLVLLGGFVAWVPDSSPLLYRGGYLVVALASAMLVGAAARPSLPLAKVLGIAPLRFIGLRSYAIYLWHWPVLVVFGPGRIAEPMLTVARVGVILLLAHLSYHLVELPVRRGALGRLWRRPVGRRLLAPAALLLVAVLGMQLVRLSQTPAPTVAVDAGPQTTLAPLASPASDPTPAASSAPPLPPPFSPPVRVAVFGDSQGMTLLLNKPADVGRYLTVSDQTIEGCGVLTDRITSRSGERRDLSAGCASWLSTWTARANRVRPQLALVMIGAWDVFDRAGPAPALPFGSPEWDQHLSAALASGVAALRGSGAQVVLSLLPCYRPVPEKGSGYWPERGDDTRTRHVNDLLRALAASDPQHIFTVEPPAQFCGQLGANRSYRWDGVHYYKPGSALYFQTVIPQLLAIPGPGS
jgi:peptidoglycan/LPS O-acetylase OafA/YrhL